MNLLRKPSNLLSSRLLNIVPPNISLYAIYVLILNFEQNCKIHHSVIGLRSCISEGAIIEDTLLMGADYYEVILNNNSAFWSLYCMKKLDSFTNKCFAIVHQMAILLMFVFVFLC